jgi:NAD+ diphosphatase
MSAAWFLVHPRGLVVRREGQQLTLPTQLDVDALGVEPGDCHSIGILEGAPAHAASIDETATLAPGLDVVSLRSLYASAGEATFAMAGRAVQITEWAATHAYCGRCATPTERVGSDRCVRCPACDLLAYPRITPAIIVLVRRGDEALLAHNARAPDGWFSTLAGFVEIGESLEDTLAREVREEVGVEVRGIRYFGSQPWPFPHSLMVGFTADYAGGDIRVDGVEIVEARWFRADALPPVPPRLSIARQLIDAWVAEVQVRR